MTKNKEVDAWLKACDNPLKPVVAAVREVILKADTRVTEAIKWQAPTFIYKGNIARFFPKAKSHASLMFHKGAVIPGDFFPTWWATARKPAPSRLQASTTSRPRPTNSRRVSWRGVR